MIRVFVDSGSSIKQNEKEKLGVEIIPLNITLGEKEYIDGVNLSNDEFYHALIEEKIFPKTSLPALGEAEQAVTEYVNNGDEVIILPISSGISGTYNSLKMLFSDCDKVRVIDTKTAVGGIRILVEEINKYRDRALDFIERKLYDLIPRIRIIAIPDTLEYLYRGGRLSKTAMIAGSISKIRPLIGIDSSTGKVKSFGKGLGRRRAMQLLVDYLKTERCSKKHSIVPSFSYNKANLEELIGMTDKEYHSQMTEFDDLDHAIACHWGPNAFGYIFVAE